MNQHVSRSKPYFRDTGLIPKLDSGDRLTQKEFHRRYEAMPKHVRAELIKGVVYMASPVRTEYHGKPHAFMMAFLVNYSIATDGVDALDNATYIAAEDYEPQPDCVMRISEKCGGRSWVNGDDYLEGSPELIVEIASSSISYDLREKYDLYEQKGIAEYIVWRVLDEQIDWFALENGKYQKLASDEHGIIESVVFPGLRLNVLALLEGKLKTVLLELQRGLESETHLEFARSLTKH